MIVLRADTRPGWVTGFVDHDNFAALVKLQQGGLHHVGVAGVVLISFRKSRLKGSISTRRLNFASALRVACRYRVR